MGAVIESKEILSGVWICFVQSGKICNALHVLNGLTSARLASVSQSMITARPGIAMMAFVFHATKVMGLPTEPALRKSRKGHQT